MRWLLLIMLLPAMLGCSAKKTVENPVESPSETANHQNMTMKITTRAQTVTSQVSRNIRLALLAGQ